TFVGAKNVVTRANARDLVFETADGYITVGAVSDAEWLGLTRALERPEWLDGPRFKTPAGGGGKTRPPPQTPAAGAHTPTPARRPSRCPVRPSPAARPSPPPRR